jgi:glycerophosphoryl diester phosphodiesterase
MKIKMRLALFFLIMLSFPQNLPAQSTEPYMNESNKDSESLNIFQKQFFVIAHRGASAYYPENTMSAFRAAVDMNADMIELDVLISKDNIPVVFHDEKLNKKTNGSGYVMDHILSDLKKLDAGSWFDPKFKNERIPTLREVLEYSNNKIFVNIEIKSEAVTEVEKNGIVELVLKLVEELGMQDKVIISSFDYRVLERVKKNNSLVKVALLYERQQSYGREPSKLVEDYKVDAFNLSMQQLADNWIKQLNENTIPFFVYTVNDDKLMESLIRAGAKGIFTDRPDLLNKVVDEVIKKKWH